MPAMLPPPAPISIMFTAGTATGKPLERVNRLERATSSSSVIGIAPSRMRHAFAVVPSHVERQHLRQRERLRDPAPDDGARHRPRLDEPQREVGRGLGGAEATVGQHHPQRRGVPGAGEPGVEIAEVVPDERLHVGVDHRGAGALVFLDLGQHLGGGGHRDLGGELAHEPRRLAFVLGVDVGVQESDRDRAHPLRPA